LKTL
jgi:hypothetical protein